MRQEFKMDEPIVVGFCGGKRHGKDTCAEYLRTKFYFEPISFADSLKAACAKAFGVNFLEFTDAVDRDQPLEPYKETRREILQLVGTEMFRNRWPDIWINTWHNNVTEWNTVVCSDVRFPNEVSKIRSFKNNLLIRVVNPNIQNADTHESEMHYKNFDVDFEIINNLCL